MGLFWASSELRFSPNYTHLSFFSLKIKTSSFEHRGWEIAPLLYPLLYLLWWCLSLKSAMASFLSLSLTSTPSPAKSLLRLYSNPFQVLSLSLYFSLSTPSCCPFVSLSTSYFSFVLTQGNAIAISHSLRPLRKRSNSASLTVRAWVKRDQAAAKAAARAADELQRLRLDNLRPQPGSRKKAKRKGRGTAAGQGNSCGFGMFKINCL